MLMKNADGRRRARALLKCGVAGGVSRSGSRLALVMVWVTRQSRIGRVTTKAKQRDAAKIGCATKKCRCAENGSGAKAILERALGANRSVGGEGWSYKKAAVVNEGEGTS